MFAMQKIRMVFKRAEEDSLMSRCWKIVEIPFDFVRNYTVPMVDPVDWNRTRAAVLPLTTIWGYCYLSGYFK